MEFNRRDAFGVALAGGAATMLGPVVAEAAPVRATLPEDWRRGFDNQRIADLGDGRFLNPLIS
ncbi:MAG: xylan 1,4-beta-xylosidase, partial [Sphingomonas sp.]